ncbi:hypothetical protein LP7551_03691 [Roseibium album]|nr:hypothetical protein LP7551_03691 [Roseibium album]
MKEFIDSAVRNQLGLGESHTSLADTQAFQKYAFRINFRRIADLKTDIIALRIEMKEKFTIQRIPEHLVVDVLLD